MFERWTDRARRSVVLAQHYAREMKHEHIGTGHLLLGFLAEGECVAAKALHALGAGTDPARSALAARKPAGDATPAGHMEFTPRLKKVCELGFREALQLGHSFVGTEHLLLGLVREGQGAGAAVLGDMGISLADVRPKVLALLRGYMDDASRPAATLAYRHPATLEDVLASLARIERHLGIAEVTADG